MKDTKVNENFLGQKFKLTILKTNNNNYHGKRIIKIYRKWNEHCR